MEHGPESGDILGTSVKRKLANLEQYFPKQDKIIYDFAKFLSERANDELVPMGFMLMAELAVYDLQKGVDGLTGEPLQRGIGGYPPAMYSVLNMYIPQIAEAIFGKEYGTNVNEIRSQIWGSVNKSAE
ncbi:hypothetical protein HON22_02390 [Candidatus Peregrinibacteria bacterium]|jgi:hypothetical protein|nr:hypothetical protein [Candidatus Peregrinibacteria bacterium]